MRAVIHFALLSVLALPLHAAESNRPSLSSANLDREPAVAVRKIRVGGRCPLEIFHAALIRTEVGSAEAFFTTLAQMGSGPPAGSAYRKRVALGFETLIPDRLSQLAQEFALEAAERHPRQDVHIWDVGSATGAAFTLPLLRQASNSQLSNLYAIALDADVNALELLRNGVTQCPTLPIPRQVYDGHLLTIPGHFPAPVRPHYPKHCTHATAMYLSAVIHFMHPKEAAAAFALAFELLEPGGRLYVKTAAREASPEHPGLKDLLGFIAAKDSFSHKYPGYVPHLEEHFPELARVYGPTLFLMTHSELNQMIRRAGFTVLNIWQADPPGTVSTAVEWYGSYLNFVAEKPGKLFTGRRTNE